MSSPSTARARLMSLPVVGSPDNMTISTDGIATGGSSSVSARRSDGTTDNAVVPSATTHSASRRALSAARSSGQIVAPTKSVAVTWPMAAEKPNDVNSGTRASSGNGAMSYSSIVSRTMCGCVRWTPLGVPVEPDVNTTNPGSGAWGTCGGVPGNRVGVFEDDDAMTFADDPPDRLVVLRLGQDGLRRARGEQMTQALRGLGRVERRARFAVRGAARGSPRLRPVPDGRRRPPAARRRRRPRRRATRVPPGSPDGRGRRRWCVTCRRRPRCGPGWCPRSVAARRAR